jgi:hypothetical protein
MPAPRRLPVSGGAIGGSGSPAFTFSYWYFCSSLKGTRTNPIRAPPSATWRRGSQKRPWNNPYSTPIALICAVIGKSIGRMTTGTSSNSVESSALAMATMSIGSLMRYAARTSCPPLMSNQSEPTARFHFGTRGRTLSSRSLIVLRSGRRKVTESPLWYV